MFERLPVGRASLQACALASSGRAHSTARDSTASEIFRGEGPRRRRVRTTYNSDPRMSIARFATISSGPGSDQVDRLQALELGHEGDVVLPRALRVDVELIDQGGHDGGAGGAPVEPLP